MRVTEIKRKLSGERLEFDCELLERSDRHAVLRYRLPHAAQVADLVLDRKSTRLNSSHIQKSRMPSSA